MNDQSWTDKTEILMEMGTELKGQAGAGKTGRRQVRNQQQVQADCGQDLDMNVSQMQGGQVAAAWTRQAGERLLI